MLPSAPACLDGVGRHRRAAGNEPELLGTEPSRVVPGRVRPDPLELIGFDATAARGGIDQGELDENPVFGVRVAAEEGPGAPAAALRTGRRACDVVMCGVEVVIVLVSV